MRHQKLSFKERLQKVLLLILFQSYLLLVYHVQLSNQKRSYLSISKSSAAFPWDILPSRKSSNTTASFPFLKPFCPTHLLPATQPEILKLPALALLSSYIQLSNYTLSSYLQHLLLPFILSLQEYENAVKGQKGQGQRAKRVTDQ